MQIELVNELNRVSKIALITNEIFGTVEILQGTSNFFLAKKLNPYTVDKVQQLYQKREFLFDNGCPFLQEFYCMTELWGEPYILFQYYDYSLADLHETNSKHRVILPESSLLKMFFGVSQVLNLFMANEAYYPFVSQRTVYCSPEGQIKVLHPILFESFFRNVESITDPCVLMYTFDQCYGQLASIVLEHASLTTVSTANGKNSADKIREAMLITCKRYSFSFFNLFRKFDFNVQPLTINESRLLNLNTAANYFEMNEKGVQKFLIGMKTPITNRIDDRSLRNSLQTQYQFNSVAQNVSQANESQRRLLIFESDEKEAPRVSVSKQNPFVVQNDMFKTAPKNQTSIFKKHLASDIPLKYSTISKEEGMFTATPIQRVSVNNNFGTTSNYLHEVDINLMDPLTQRQSIMSRNENPQIKQTVRYTLQTPASDYLPNQVPSPKVETLNKEVIGTNDQEPKVYNPTDFFQLNSIPEAETSNHEITENSFFKDVYPEPEVAPKLRVPPLQIQSILPNAKVISPVSVPVPEYIMQINDTVEHPNTTERIHSTLEMKSSNYAEVAPRPEISIKKMLGDVYLREYIGETQVPRTMKSQIDDFLKNETLVQSVEINNYPQRVVSMTNTQPVTLHDFPENITVAYYSPYN